MGNKALSISVRRCALVAVGLVLVACQSSKRSSTGDAAAASGGAAGTGGASGMGGASSSTGGSASGGASVGGGGASAPGGRVATGGVAATGGGAGGMSGVDAGAAGSTMVDAGLPASAACAPGVGTGPLSDSEVSCNESGTTFGVPNGAACYGKTYLLPSPLVAGADNALSFVLTGWGPYNFELWGTDTSCKAEELLWWGPFGAGTQCAQFKPSKAYTKILFVYRQMYASSYSFTTPSTMMCPGGTCPMGTTGTGKVGSAPLSAPIGNYELSRWERVYPGGYDFSPGGSGRMTVAWLGAKKDAGQVQPLAAGVFRMPATDTYGDAWYCIGSGSTLTEAVDSTTGVTKRFQFSLRGITRLGPCGPTPGTGTLSATIHAPVLNDFATDVAGTISAWTGTGLVTNQYCSGPKCDFRFQGTAQQHYVHVETTAENLGVGVPAPVPVTSVTWLVQASATEPFSMACASEGTLDYRPNELSKLQLSKVTGPLPCPGTPIPNDSFDFTVER